MTSYAINIDEVIEQELRPKPSDPVPTRDTKLPDPVVPLTDAQRSTLCQWLDEWIDELTYAQQAKLAQWADEERAYKARSDGPQEEPFVGASGDHVPLIAMAVDPIIARLDTGIFKNSPVFKFKALRKSMTKYVEPLERFVEHFQKHQADLRAVSQPRIIELAMHGTMAFKVVYECSKYKTYRYNKQWKREEREVVDYEGPRIVGVPLANLLFPPYQQSLQECPIVGERIRMTWEQLRKLETTGVLKDVERIKGQDQINALNVLEEQHATSANHRDSKLVQRFFDIHEMWFDYDMFNTGVVQRWVVTYHRDTQTILQLRLNWYFHQRKPYVVIPYSVTKDSLYGMGIAEMVKPLQDTLTQWQRHSLNNAYLANIRMFVIQKDAKIEQKPKLYSGRAFYVEDPSKHFIPINAAADTYPSTLTERQNIIGLAEKRTGVSDYMTGRESPIVGSRATATSTLALIQEGTRRVEAVMENIRAGYAEILKLCVSVWMQYGTGDITELVFGGDEVEDSLREFFDQVDSDNINGMMAVELSATDASSNRTVRQQTQLALIQTMMVYLEKSIQAASTAVQSVQQAPQLAQFIGEIMDSARHMYTELLTNYEIRNPEAYLPDLQAFLATLGPGGAAQPAGGTSDVAAEPNIQALGGMAGGPQGIS